MSDDPGATHHRGTPASEGASLAGEPSPLVGAARGLAKVAGAVGALVGAAAVIAAVVALLY